MQMMDESVREKADELFDTLIEAGVDVFYDDRDESPGVKLNDGDLLGFPVRVVVSKRNIAEGMVELKCRNNEEAVKVPFEEAVGAIRDSLAI
jgi:prolyl-tRNA synthetase